jgi:hypothetical protein
MIFRSWAISQSTDPADLRALDLAIQLILL